MVRGVLVEEVVQPANNSPFYQRFDFNGIVTKEDVFIFLKKALVKNIYDAEQFVADKSLLVGLAR